MLINSNEYLNIVESIQQEIRTAQYRATISVNQELLILCRSIDNVISSHKTWYIFLLHLQQDTYPLSSPLQYRTYTGDIVMNRERNGRRLQILLEFWGKLWYGKHRLRNAVQRGAPWRRAQIDDETRLRGSPCSGLRGFQ